MKERGVVYRFGSYSSDRRRIIIRCFALLSGFSNSDRAILSWSAQLFLLHIGDLMVGRFLQRGTLRTPGEDSYLIYPVTLLLLPLSCRLDGETRKESTARANKSKIYILLHDNVWHSLIRVRRPTFFSFG